MLVPTAALRCSVTLQVFWFSRHTCLYAQLNIAYTSNMTIIPEGEKLLPTLHVQYTVDITLPYLKPVKTYGDHRFYMCLLVTSHPQQIVGIRFTHKTDFFIFF